MYYFCTYFDQHYLTRGLALYRSLRQHCPSFRLWVLCMDQTCHQVLSKLGFPEINLVRLEEFENGDRELLDAKGNRSRIEYYFTCTPSLPIYILENWQEVDVITYLDADLYFFCDPWPVYYEFGDSSIGIIGHRFPPKLKEWEQYGLYNVGWLMFRREENAMACLRWWRQRCIEWCYDQVKADRFADQKYLDDWPDRFRKVTVLQHKGANLAPWNLENYEIRRRGGKIWVDDQPLVFFHFHNLKQAQGKLVRVMVGEVFDVAVDIRRSSPTFGKWVGFNISAASKKIVWIPPGIAHGFVVLSEYAEFLYKTTDYYSPESERTIAWNDPELAIAWPLSGTPTLSAKDKNGVAFQDAELFP